MAVNARRVIVTAVASSLVLSILVLMLIAPWLARLFWPQPEVRSCEPTTAPGELQPRPPDPIPSLKVAGTPKPLALGRSLSPMYRELIFELTSGNNVLKQGDQLAVDFYPFQRTDDTQLDPSNFSARAIYKDDRVRLKICIARTATGQVGDDGASIGGSRSADAGTYIGTFIILDPRVARTEIPFTFTLAYPYWPVAIFYALIIAMAALVWTWILASGGSVSARAFAQWFGSKEGLTAWIPGAVFAAGAVVAIYFNSPTWALDVGGFIALASGVFAGFMTGTTVSAVRPTAPGARAGGGKLGS